MIKAATLLLIGIAVVAMFGGLRLRMRRPGGQAKCTACGRPRIGKGPCACGRG